MSLLAEMNEKAMQLGVPISVHMDVTYRCNERCEHCYLDHEDYGEMSTAEIKNVLDQLAEAGVFFLTFSGGEVFMRRDFLELVEYARALQFNVKVKTNGVMVKESEAQRLRELGVEQLQISVYSHRPEIHDAITKLPGSLKRTLESIRFLKSQGLKVTVANVLMKVNRQDQPDTQAMFKNLGVEYTLDPTVTPMMDGDTGVLDLRVDGDALREVFKDPELVGDVEEFCAPPAPVDNDVMQGYSCSAGHTACYISPYGDVFPCVQFPLPTGNVRRQKFQDIWQNSPQLQEVRGIQVKDLPVCSTCTHAASCSRCPGLAYMEGSMRGPSTADCEKSYARTGIPSANMLRKAAAAGASGRLVQILPMSV
jgi:radical SAM protein with 4Fe4S-binding SPASM domain